MSNIEVSLLLKQHMQVTLTGTRTITSTQAPYFTLSEAGAAAGAPNLLAISHPHNHQHAGTLIILGPGQQSAPQPYPLAISLTQLLPPFKPVVPEFECLGVFADDAFFGFGESFGFSGVDVHGDFEVGTAAG